MHAYIEKTFNPKALQRQKNIFEMRKFVTDYLKQNGNSDYAKSNIIDILYSISLKYNKYDSSVKLSFKRALNQLTVGEALMQFFVDIDELEKTN